MSVTGLKERALCSMMLLIVCASAALTQASGLFAAVQFKAATRDCQDTGPAVLGFGLTLACPLWVIAPQNGTGWGGHVTSLSTEAAPEDSPKMVTLFGLPPNEAMLRCTQSKARRWSRKPALRDVMGSSGELEKPKAADVRKIASQVQQHGYHLSYNLH